MQTNHYYSIGSTHVTCEDYARSGITKNGNAYAIVCDGCSSSPDTDVGARIVGLEAEKLIHQQEIIPLGEEIAFIARDKILNLGLQSEAMDATLIVAFSNGKQVDVIGWGDGACMLLEQVRKSWALHVYEFDPNYPFYLSYITDRARKEEWQKATYKLTEAKYYSYGNTTGVEDKIEVEWKLSYDAIPGRVVYITTDGITSFRDKDNNYISPPFIGRELAKIFSPTGKFVEKRVRRLIRNYKNEGTANADDFAVAGISILGE